MYIVVILYVCVKNQHNISLLPTTHKKGKAVPLQALSGPEGSRKLKVPRFHDNGTGW